VRSIDGGVQGVEAARPSSTVVGGPAELLRHPFPFVSAAEAGRSLRHGAICLRFAGGARRSVGQPEWLGCATVQAVKSAVGAVAARTRWRRWWIFTLVFSSPAQIDPDAGRGPSGLPVFALCRCAGLLTLDFLARQPCRGRGRFGGNSNLVKNVNSRARPSSPPTSRRGSCRSHRVWVAGGAHRLRHMVAALAADACDRHPRSRPSRGS